MMVLLYGLPFLIALWYSLRLAFGARRAAHLAIFVPSAMLLVGLCSGLGLVVTFVFGNPDDSSYWHDIGNTLFESRVPFVTRVVDNAETLGALTVLPVVFVLDLVVSWWLIMTQHLTIPLAITHALGAFIIWVWWHVLEYWFGLYVIPTEAAPREQT